ncbi:hypothetical protein [Silvimonas amylolytica]|uniref:Uncharacterized protein n=1 Tax=Silvimonas amylolytica TaxID=449663 RepID=A0ABQ2PML3_9NEIS|nr:hypothetical protein [Silvimonas amylolytica]GGP26833.1 hypothetical protein GCM10010971_26520 [Silvimonas amylolytica]
MGERQRYRRRPGIPVVAVQLKLDTEGFTYKKWGEEQRCKPHDWLVNNNGDVYTVEADSFANTYTVQSNGLYIKTGKVWAVQAAEAGRVTTKEGGTNYDSGDWLVSNEADGADAYAVSAKKFEELYELDE